MNKLRSFVICSLILLLNACEPSEQRQGTWFGGKSENQAPIINFTAQSAGLKLTLEASATDNESDKLTYLWQIDIGADDPVEKTGKLVSYSFKSVGRYDVVLFVDDGHGWVSLKQTVEIKAPIDDAVNETVTGQLLFESLCSGCHAVDGQSGIAINFVNYSNQNALTNYIHSNMPSGNSEACDLDCAELVSDYLTQQNNLFDETNVTPPSETGQALFAQLCASCHSIDGQSDTLIDFSKYADRPSLANYIQVNMPFANSEACDGQCADLISEYLTLENDLYQVLDLELAKQMYQNSEYGYCDTCHEGIDGQSVKIKLGATELRDFNWDRFASSDELIQYVELNMPYNDHEACSEVDNCAALAGTYMWSQKEVVDEIVNVEGQALFESLCTSCHQQTGIGTRTNDDLGDGNYMIRFKAGIDPNDLSNVVYPDKDSFISKVALSMPQGLASDTCQSDCASDIADFLWELNKLNVEEVYSCSQPNYVPKQVRLLTSFEYKNTLMDTLNLDVSELIAYFPKEIGGDNFENDVASANVDAARVQEYWNAALSIAQAAISAHSSEPLYDCDINEASCVSSFITDMGKALFRRPLNVDEQTRFEALFDDSLTESDPLVGVQLTLQAMLSSPHFLYRSEIGELQSDGVTSLLTPYESASLLSYTFTASSPDAILMLAADNNELNSAEQLSAQVTRLLDTDKAKAQLTRFAAQWFGADEIMDLPRNYVQFTDFTDEVRVSMKKEFDLFVADIIFNDLSVERLLDADYSFLNQTLADYYGVDASIADGTFAKTNFADAPRQGVISMGAVIASHAIGDENSPVFRGIFVRKDLLCQDLPSPPDISGQGGGFDSSLPVRERLAQHANIASCSNCHKVIDDLGYALENYNAIGQYITHEYIASTGEILATPIDASGVLVGIESFLDTTSEPFNNALELASIISQNDVSKQCAIEKWQQYSYGRSEEIVCQQSSLYDLWQDKEFTMKQLLIESVKVPGYLIRQ